jgi:hypothetical protein
VCCTVRGKREEGIVKRIVDKKVSASEDRSRVLATRLRRALSTDGLDRVRWRICADGLRTDARMGGSSMQNVAVPIVLG